MQVICRIIRGISRCNLSIQHVMYTQLAFNLTLLSLLLSSSQTFRSMAWLIQRPAKRYTCSAAKSAALTEYPPFFAFEKTVGPQNGDGLL